MSIYVNGNLNDLTEDVLAALEAGGTTEHPLIDGRIIAVFASPEKGASEKMAMGIAALPAAYSTPAHSHPAEEFAFVLRGSGTITIEAETIAVGPGSLVVTPPNKTHITSSNADGPLVVYWTYGPAGSEKRWIS